MPFKELRYLAATVACSVLLSVARGQTPDLVKQADRLADQGNWSEAGPLYARAEAEFHKAGDTRDEIYSKLGRLHQTVEDGSYRVVRMETVRMLSIPLVDSDPRLHIRALALLGSIDINSNTEAAIRDWTQIRAVAQEVKDAKWENRADGQLGLLKGVVGNIGAAAVALNTAMQKAEEMDDSAAYISFASALAGGMVANSMADRAIRVLDKADEVVKNKGFKEAPLQLTIVRIRALINLPEGRIDSGLNEASRLIAPTMAQAQRERVIGAQTELFNAEGQIAARRNDLAEAEKFYRQAARLANSASLPRLEGEAWLRLSQFYRGTTQFAKAETAIDNGIRVIQRVEEGFDFPGFLAEKADVLASLGQTREADDLFRRATSLAEGLLVNAPSSQAKSGIIAALNQIYVGHFRLAWAQMHDADYAFTIIENARGRALFDSIRYARRSEAVGSIQTKAEAEIAKLQRSLLHDRLTTAQTSHALAMLDLAYERLSPEEFTRKRAEMSILPSRPASIRAVQTRLGTQDAIVEYVLDERGSHALQITRESLKVYDLPPRSQFSKLSRSFVTAVRNGGDSLATGQAFYSQLLAPIIPTGATSLIIVPDGPLNLVPFSALQTQDGGYLAQSMTITASPSATIYALLSRARPFLIGSKPFLGIAFSPPEQGGSASGRQLRGLADLRSGELKPLRFAREEVAEAAKVFGPLSTVLEGAQASEAALKAQPLGLFQVIHIAAHGVSDEVEPDRAALVLAPGSEGEDGLWQVREIVRSRLAASIVVLSACETGSGRLQGQEGVMNMARAFLTAGSLSVVASLWDVDDRSTATLMERFYVHLQSGSSVSESLRDAQKDFIRDYGEKAKPNLWAGFEVIGYGAKRLTKQSGAEFRATR